MNFTIENAQPQDRDEIIKVLKPWNMHRIPSPEIEEFDFSCLYIAKIRNEIVGVSGYKLLADNTGKTRSLAVYPELQGSGIGKALQEIRLEAMYNAGVEKVITNADRPSIILWYIKHYGYYEIGQRKKLVSHGFDEVDYATVLELDLTQYMKNKQRKENERIKYISVHDPYPLAPYPPLIINVALTGMLPTKTLTPYVPISIDEIVEDAIKVHDAGASIVHLHARNKEGHPTSDAQYYEKIITSIRRERPELICCATTSGRGGQSFEERSEVLHLTGSAKPDMASLTLGSLNFLSGPSINSLEMIQLLALLMKENNIKPELEIFDLGMVNIAKYLERHNMISGKKYFNILLGNMNTAAATIGDLSHIYTSLPENSIWAAAGLGKFQLAMNTISIATGGNVRVGLEDNVYYDAAQKNLATNQELVERVVRISAELERPIASATETRALLGLQYQ